MKSLSAERLYAIADFQNIKFTSTISEIPDEVGNNPKAIGLLFYAQCLDLDMAYKSYMNLRKEIVDGKVKDVLEFLANERNQTYQQLLAEINKEQGE